MNSTQQQQWNPQAHYKDADVAASYDKVRFSSAAGRYFNNRERTIIRRTFSDLPSGSTIIDFPCGTGRLAEPLLDAGYLVRGADISPQMLEVAAARLSRFGSRFSTEVLDAKAVDASHEQFQGALCARVLMHFPLAEQIAFLRGVARLTSGPIVITHCLDSSYQRFRRGVKRVLRHQTPAAYPVTNEQIEQLLSACGLKERRRYRMHALVSEAVYIVATR